MPVPYYDHPAMMAAQRSLYERSLARVLDAGRPDWGAEVPAFEVELAAACGAAAAFATSSGTQALVLALRALGVGPGDEVITVGNTDSSTPSSIRQVGAVPVLVDIEPATRCIDPAKIAPAITPHTRAVLPVDMHGHPADYDAIGAIARNYGLCVIADACISLGATDRRRKVGTLADITCLSFGAGKLLGTIGPGGACVTSDPALGRRLRMLGGYGQDRTVPGPWPYETDAMNVRMGELPAAILRDRLSLLPDWLALRRAQAAAYMEGLTGLGLDLPHPRPGTDPAWRNYVIGTDNPDGLARALARRGVETKRLYAPPITHEPGYAAMAVPLPVTEAEAERLLCLPIGPHLGKAQIAEVILAIRAATQEAPPSRL